MKNILFFLFCILCISQVGGAQPFSGPMGSMPQGMPPMGQMPQFQGMKTGVFNGTLVTKEASGKKTPVVGQTVVILVFQNGQRMLMLNKKTDEKGQFQFKNIFIDPSFSYQIGTMWNQNLYVIPELHLEENQKEKKIEFLIGEGSPYFVSTMEAAQRESSAEDSGSPQGPQGVMQSNNSQNTTQEGSFSVNSYWEYTYQKIALVLCLMVLIFGFYHLVQPRRDV